MEKQELEGENMHDYSMLQMIVFGITILITLGAQGYLSSQYNKTKEIMTKKGMSGKDVARRILDSNGLKNIKVVETSGTLTDHYDPTAKTIRLSTDVYNNSSIASASVAAHECGHAIQDKDNYTFLRIRHRLVPVVNFSSSAGYIAIAIGLMSGLFGLLMIGIILELVILLFQLITLPVEFNASNRGLKNLKELKILEEKELPKSKGMLKAAALTYVAAVANAILQILRLIMMFQRRN